MRPKEYYCPHHNKKLVLREAKHGSNRGTKFWGCPTWNKTACNYTISYEYFEKQELTLKEELLQKIKNKNGRISPVKVIGYILLLPIYILLAVMRLVFPIRKHF